MSGYSKYCTPEEQRRRWRERNHKRYSDPAIRDRLLEQRKGYQLKNKLMYTYGITVEEYNRMSRVQGGLCALCHQPPKNSKGGRLHIDHDHETNEVRGLLCAGCNTAVGYYLRITKNFGLDAVARYLDAVPAPELCEQGGVTA